MIKNNCKLSKVTLVPSVTLVTGIPILPILSVNEIVYLTRPELSFELAVYLAVQSLFTPLLLYYRINSFTSNIKTYTRGCIVLSVVKLRVISSPGIAVVLSSVLSDSIPEEVIFGSVFQCNTSTISNSDTPSNSIVQDPKRRMQQYH